VGSRSSFISGEDVDGRKREVTLRFLAEPADVNFGGKVHGGAVMKWIDQAGYACAGGWSGQYCVTVYVGGIRFLKPVLIGYLVEVNARLIYTGRTSMHIAVDVWAGDPRGQERTHTTHCVIIFVAVNAQGEPVEVPCWSPSTAEDRTLEQYAKRLMELRRSIEEEMQQHLH
jgi:acyl-CoA hydrolase